MTDAKDAAPAIKAALAKIAARAEPESELEQFALAIAMHGVAAFGPRTATRRRVRAARVSGSIRSASA